MKKFVTSVLVLTSIVVAGAVQSVSADVNIYSSRKEALIKPILDQFTAQTGITVNLVTGGDDALISRLTTEGKKSPADLLITSDAGRLHRAKAANVLAVVDSETVKSLVPENFRDAEGYWVGLTMRARPIFYVKENVDPNELSTYEALTENQWKGRICIRSSSNIYNQSLVASMIETSGIEAAQSFAEGLVANFARPPSGGDTDQLKAAAAGVCDIAIANTYYYGRLVNSDDEADQNVANRLGIFWPNQNDRGTHVNVSGVALTQSARNTEEAIALIEFMLTPDAQNWYSEVNNEYPVVSSVQPSQTLSSWGAFKADDVNLSILGENNRTAVELMDRAGWK